MHQGREQGRLVGELQRLKRERKDLINTTQSNIEMNHLAYQEKMKRVQQLLQGFARTCEDSQRNIVSPLKPIPQPVQQAQMQEGKSAEVIGQRRKKSSHGGRQEGASRQRNQKIISR